MINGSFYELVLEGGWFSQEDLDEMLRPENVTDPRDAPEGAVRLAIRLRMAEVLGDLRLGLSGKRAVISDALGPSSTPRRRRNGLAGADSSR